MDAEQYRIVAARRESYDKLVWQTPTLAIAAEGFLLAAALNEHTGKEFALILSAAALIVALAAVHLFHRFRWLERYDSELLAQYEKTKRKDDPNFAVLFEHGRRPPLITESGDALTPNCLARYSTFCTWSWVLVIFLGLAVYGVYISAKKVWLPSASIPTPSSSSR